MKHILVVDDESDVALLFNQKFRHELRSGELKFEYARNGEDALRLLHSVGASDISLVITDINMPGMNGFELLEALKNEYPTLTVMVITAYGDAQNFEKTRILGADDFLTKPVNFEVLRDKLYKKGTPPASMN